jgi:hypothetical protein
MIYSIGSIGDDVFHWLPMIFKNFPSKDNEKKLFHWQPILKKINPLAYKFYFHWPHNFVSVGTSHL